MDVSPSIRWRIGAGVFVISLAALALEVLQTRLFAFVLWHHLAFLVISIAVLGFAAAGAALSSARVLHATHRRSTMAVLCLLFSVSCPIGPLFLARYSVDVFGQVGPWDIAYVGLYYLLFALPYFLAGAVIALALAQEAATAPWFYCCNLLGSAAGCFLIFVTLQPMGAEGTLLLIAALGALAAGLTAARRALRVAAMAAAGVLVLFSPFANDALQIRVVPSKLLAQAQRDPRIDCAGAGWTPVCRIDVCTHRATGRRGIVQDGDAGTALVDPTSAIPSGDLRLLPYVVMHHPSVLVVGVGGGTDVQAAIDHGARTVTGVELNPITLRLAQQVLPSSRVQLYNGEGRAFVRRSTASYDLIQLTGVDTYTALASGAYVLAEDYLYTLEAFHDYLDHLTDDGILSIVRLAFPVPRETLRVMITATQALAERGVREPLEHIVIIRARPAGSADPPFTTATSFAATLVKARPFTTTELDRLRAHADRFGLVLEYLPDASGTLTRDQLDALRGLRHRVPALHDYPLGAHGTTPFYAFAQSVRSGTEQRFLGTYPYDVRPVRDDAPFFFNQHRLGSVWRWIMAPDVAAKTPAAGQWVAATTRFQTRPVGLLLLVLTLIQLTVLIALCIFVPLFVFQREGVQGAFLAAPLGYFFCLGVGYMLLMISAMQRFGLILGHPSYAISVTMATFLGVSGLGSLVCGRFPLARARLVVGAAATGVLVCTGVLHYLLPAVTRMALAQPFSLRVALTAGLVSPMAFVMGMCFPTGVRVVGHQHRQFIPWAYGVNGAGTVLGSVLAVCLALAMGFMRVQWVAAGLYLLAAALMRRMVRPRHPSD